MEQLTVEHTNKGLDRILASGLGHFRLRLSLERVAWGTDDMMDTCMQSVHVNHAQAIAVMTRNVVNTLSNISFHS